jgi:hypothetical protein
MTFNRKANIMVYLRFINGGSDLDTNTMRGSSMVPRIKAIILKAVSNLPCPIHSEGNFATVLIDTDNSEFSWEIVSPCCEGFREILEYAIPYPLDRVKRDHSQ